MESNLLKKIKFRISTMVFLELAEPIELTLTPKVRLLAVIGEDSSPSSREMLKKIFTACGLDELADTQTLEWSAPIALASNIAQHEHFYRVVVFGLSPNQLGAQWELPGYQWVKIGGQEWCFAERLEIIEGDMERKKRLWNELKVFKE